MLQMTTKNRGFEEFIIRNAFIGVVNSIVGGYDGFY